MAEDDSLLAVVAGGTVDRVTCRRRRRGSRWTWWRRAHLGWPLPRRDRVESAGWLPLHPVVAHRGTGSVLPLIEEVVLTATLTTSPSVVHLRHVADLAPEDRVGLPTSRSADPATHPPSHLLGGSPCVRWVSVRTSSSATWAYADDRTPCGPISALSRWRHGFESRWGCDKKYLFRSLGVTPGLLWFSTGVSRSRSTDAIALVSVRRWAVTGEHELGGTDPVAPYCASR
jgi:hypothetical protein